MPSRRPCLQKGVSFHLSEPGESRCAEHRLTKWASRAGTSMAPGWSARRSRILQRDGYRCVVCGSKVGLAVDHITPRSQGGTDEDSNLQTLCKRCHGTKTAHEAHAGMRRMRQGVNP
jgi:5-methylcytosine-specific restriction protein A